MTIVVLIGFLAYASRRFHFRINIFPLLTANNVPNVTFQLVSRSPFISINHWFDVKPINNNLFSNIVAMKSWFHEPDIPSCWNHGNLDDWYWHRKQKVANPFLTAHHCLYFRFKKVWTNNTFCIETLTDNNFFGSNESWEYFQICSFLKIWQFFLITYPLKQKWDSLVKGNWQ